MVANALWGWLQQWKQHNWQRRGKPVWAAELWQDIAARVENLVVKVRHVDAHVPKSRATEEHENNQQVDRAAKIEVAQVDLDWQHKGELFIARWAHDSSGHQGRDATYRWARDQGVDLTMDTIAQVIHECETCPAIKQAKRLKPLWYGGRWLKYKYGEAWQILHSHRPVKASTMCSQWWKQPLGGWKHTLCPMPPPGTPSWALKSKFCGDMAPQRELSQTTGLISETVSLTPGPKSMVLSGSTTFPTMHQPLGR
uniref:RNase H type-1 domain-containing protein n=1 Tax=Calidris pygmaea TaxID=425635 RepID=A0A8C3PKW3_9CHAR